MTCVPVILDYPQTWLWTETVASEESAAWHSWYLWKCWELDWKLKWVYIQYISTFLSVWTEQSWVTFLFLFLNGPNRETEECFSLISLYFFLVYFSGLDVASLHFTGLHFTSLHYTVVHLSEFWVAVWKRAGGLVAATDSKQGQLHSWGLLGAERGDTFIVEQSVTAVPVT